MAIPRRGLSRASTGRAVHSQQIDMTPPHQQEAYAHTGVLPRRLAALQKIKRKVFHRYMFVPPLPANAQGQRTRSDDRGAF